MKMNLFNFELGTFQQEKDQLTLKIDNSKCRYDKLDELNNLRQSNQLFLNIDCIEEKDHQTVIQYAIPKEFKNLIQIKNEPKAIKVDDGGPIFYNQERIGKNGKEIGR